MTADQLQERALRYEIQAHTHNVYDQADAAAQAHDDAKAKELYAQGQWLDAAADLCRSEAAELAHA